MRCECCGKELKENEVCDCQHIPGKEQSSFKGTVPDAKRHFSKSRIILISAILLAAVLGIVFVFTRPEKVELSFFLEDTPIISGLNGKAALSTEELFDYIAMDEAIVNGKQDGQEVLEENLSDDELEKALADTESKMNEIEQVNKDIVLEIMVNGKKVKEAADLSNGDTVKVKVSSKQAVNKEFNKKLVSGSKEYKISGLKDGKELSVFEDDLIKVEFVGGNGAGKVYAKVISDEEAYTNISVDVKDMKESYNNGDKVIIQAAYDRGVLAEQGYYLKEETKEYTVSGLSDYFTSVKDIPGPVLEKLKSLSLEEMNDDFYRVFIGAGDGKVSFESAYFLLAKSIDGGDGIGYQPYNQVLIVGSYYYEGTQEKAYCYSQFSDVSVSEDGEVLVRDQADFDVGVDNYRLSEEDLTANLEEMDGYECSPIQ